MKRQDVPKLNKDNFASWKSRIRLHLSGIGNDVTQYLDTEYVLPTGPLTVDQLREKHEHYSMVIELSASLSDVEFEDVKDCKNAKTMWDKLKLVHGGDANVLRAKAESLRGKFDDLKMKEGENITQYNTRIKEVVNAIWGVGGVLEEDTVVSKILRTLLPCY